MTALTQDKIIEALSVVQDPDQGRDIVGLKMISGIQTNERGEVIFMIEVDPQRGPKLEPLRQAAEKAVANVPGVSKVTAVLTAQKSPAPAPQPHSKNPPVELPDIKNIIAVASGKGGVGKSTLASNLAVSMANAGKSVGLLDADIYGPSQPRMMGLEGQKPGGTDGAIEPLIAHGVKVMSIGFMVDNEAPLVWRGPMVQSALIQLLRDVNWGALDVLLIDMPPGTGDAQLTLAQKVPLTGAVIISTPQDIALLDARKGVEMFRKVNVPILGVVENMSTHICSNCGHEEHIFGHDGAKKEAEKLGVPFLGAIALSADIRMKSDAGEPVIDTFDQIASKVAGSISDPVSKT